MLIRTSAYRGVLCTTAALSVGLLVMTAMGCAAVPPYRTLVPPILPNAEECSAAYERARWNDASGLQNQAAETIHVQVLIDEMITKDKREKGASKCWSSAVERHAAAPEHPAYDLFSLEFDNRGWPQNISRGRLTVPSQLSLLMDSLEQMVERREPLQVILFVHGLHHSAAPDDSSVISFRRLLEQVAVAERSLCRERRSRFVSDSHDSARCNDSENVPVRLKKRHVVGIYLGWRGDPSLSTGLENLSSLERKSSSEAAPLGTVQEFFSRIHSFSEEHDCHTPSSSHHLAGDLTDCVDVRLLAVGYSSGGLIAHRASAPSDICGTTSIVSVQECLDIRHDDLLSDHFFDFIRQVYFTVLRDEDDTMDDMRLREVSRAAIMGR
jgi:hypothetical protein